MVSYSELIWAPRIVLIHPYPKFTYHMIHITIYGCSNVRIWLLVDVPYTVVLCTDYIRLDPFLTIYGRSCFVRMTRTLPYKDVTIYGRSIYRRYALLTSVYSKIEHPYVDFDNFHTMKCITSV